MGLGIGGGIGGGRSDRTEQYFVLPKPRQRSASSRPDEWKVAKGFDDRSANTVRTYNDKQSAQSKAKTLAKKNDTVLTVFDAAKKSSRQFDYR